MNLNWMINRLDMHSVLVSCTGKLVAIFLVSIFCNANASAVSYDIDDLYWGSDDHGHGDVIGHDAKFDIHGANVTRSGNILTVDIFTNFANPGLGSYPFATYSGNGIGFGDLFLADEWDPYPSANFKSDNYANGTDWDYGFSLDDRWSATGGTGTWYSLAAAVQNTDTLLSQSFINCCTFRNGQEVAVDLGSDDITALAAAGNTWSVDPSLNKVSFVIDISGTTLASSSVIGIHWGMTCANDVIEGAYQNVSVPEPGTLLLLLAGLISMVLVRRYSPGLGEQDDSSPRVQLLLVAR